MQGVSKATLRRLLPAFYKADSRRRRQSADAAEAADSDHTKEISAITIPRSDFVKKGQVQIRPHLSTGHAKAGRLAGCMAGYMGPDAFLPSFLSVETEHVSVPPFLCP